MKAIHATKKALIAGAVSLILCFAMLIGTSYAWFTASVTSGRNIITTGNLDVTMEYANGTEAPESADWKDASEGAIFSYKNWEPGYLDAKHIKISNVGTLALKYEIVIETEAGGRVDDITDAIEVYYADPAIKLETREDLAACQYLGTLTEVTADLNAYGELPAGKLDTVTLALKMKESADNRYQNQQIGPFTVKLIATQLSSENDSFDNNYDQNATYATVVTSAEELTAALAKGQDTVLGADITLTEEHVAWDYNGATNKAAHLYIPEGARLTLDLNGYTLRNTHVSSTVRHDVIVSYGTLTLTDSVGTGSIISDNNSQNVNTSGGFAVLSYGDLMLQDIRIDGNTGSYAVYIEGEGKTMTVNNATVSGRGALAVYNGAHGIINSGDFSIDELTSNARDNVVALYNATAEIHGGNFDGTLKTLGSNDSFNWKGSSCVMLMGSTSKAYVYGGTFEAREADLFSHGAGCAVYAYGGTFNTVNALGNSALHEHNAKATVEIHGGDFIYDPSDYLAAGYVVTLREDRYIVAAK